MFKKLIKNKKAQNTAEYAILISLVVAGIIAMQTYAQRSLQARVRDAGKYLADQTNTMNDGSVQYEPYYLSTIYNIDTDTYDETRLGQNLVAKDMNSLRTRASGGIQQSKYDTSLAGVEGGV